jgi:hypothetical protein
MSKQNPNQQYYKTGGRSQSDGPDRLHANENESGQVLEQARQDKKDEHPAVARAKKK